MKSGTKGLRIASVIQIIMGVLGILFIYFLLHEGDVSAAGVDGRRALTMIAATYASHGFQIFAGFVGLALAKKKSLLTVIFGILLFIPQLIAFWNADNDFLVITLNVVLLVIPYLYLHNAYKNFKE